MDDALVGCQISSSSLLVLIRFKHRVEANIREKQRKIALLFRYYILMLMF